MRNAIMDIVLSNEIDVVVLSLGVTATIMATELSCRGIRAMDVGQFEGTSQKLVVSNQLSTMLSSRSNWQISWCGEFHNTRRVRKFIKKEFVIARSSQLYVFEPFRRLQEERSFLSFRL